MREYEANPEKYTTYDNVDSMMWDIMNDKV